MRWFDFKERQTDPKCFNDILVVFEAPQISVILSGCVLYAYGFVTCFLLLQESLASYLTISNVILWSWRIWTIFALSSLVKLAFWSMLHNIAMKKYLLFLLACCTEPYVIGHACAFQCRQTFVTIMFKYMQSIRRHLKKLVSHKILERTVSWSLFIKNRIAHYRTAPKIVFAIGFCLAKLWPCAWSPLLLLILNDFTLISY